MNSNSQAVWPYRIPWLEHARLWMVTDIAAARGRALSAVAADGIRGGVDVVVVRLKGMESDTVIREARAIAKVCGETNTPWVLSHKIELVDELKPDGIHLGKSDPPVNEVRLTVGDGIAIGYSTHQIEEMAFVAGLGADYCWYSPIFNTRKSDGIVWGVGLDFVTLANIAAYAVGRGGEPFPVVYLGGVTPGNAGQIIRRGGTRVAAISALCGSDNVLDAAREFRRALDRKTS